MSELCPPVGPEPHRSHMRPAALLRLLLSLRSETPASSEVQDRCTRAIVLLGSAVRQLD